MQHIIPPATRAGTALAGVLADEDNIYPTGAVAVTRLGLRYDEVLAFMLASL